MVYKSSARTHVSGVSPRHGTLRFPGHPLGLPPGAPQWIPLGIPGAGWLRAAGADSPGPPRKQPQKPIFEHKENQNHSNA